MNHPLRTTSLSILSKHIADWSKQTFLIHYPGPFILITPSNGPPRIHDLSLFKGVSFLIGRMKDCELRLQDRSISRHHASLTVITDQWLLEDHNSTYGTFLNGRLEAKKPYRLQYKENFRLGTINLKLLGASTMYDLISPAETAEARRRFRARFNLPEKNEEAYVVLRKDPDGSIPTQRLQRKGLGECP